MNPLPRYFAAHSGESPTRLALRTTGQITAAELVTFFLTGPPVSGEEAAPTPGAGGDAAQGDARESPDRLPGPLVASPALCDPGDGVVGEAAPRSRLSPASLFSSVVKETQAP